MPERRRSNRYRVNDKLMIRIIDNYKQKLINRIKYTKKAGR